MVQPDEIGGVETQISYLFVEDARAHHARAKAAGAEIVLDIDVESQRRPRIFMPRSRRTCMELRHLRPVGAAVRRAQGVEAAAQSVAGFPPACRSRRLVGARTCARGRERSCLPGLRQDRNRDRSAQAEQTPDLASGDLHDLREQLSRERLARVAADRHVKDIREELAQERRARAAAELAAKDVRDNPVQVQMANPGPAIKAAENAAAEARNELGKIRVALQTATEQLAQAQKARQAAELGAKEAREQFAQLRSARETAENSAREMRELAARERSARIATERTLRKAKASPYTPYPLQ